MTKFDKLYAEIVRNPKDVKFEELEKLIIRFGFERRKQRSGTSHFQYTHPDLTEILTIPFALQSNLSMSKKLWMQSEN